MKISTINKFFLASVAGTGLMAAGGCSQKKQEVRKPNIIYIMADDLGYADLGCYGSKRIKTPNLDRMAAEGIRFSNHYAGTAVCAPSRCSLMTGLTTGHCQVRGNLQWEPYGQIPLAENTTTVASKLKEAGYKTALIGKWGLGVEGTSGDPLKQGFDYSFGYLCQVLAHNHCPEFLMENGQKVMLENKVVYMDPTHWTAGLGSYPVERKQYSQELFTQKALSYIEENKENPFFLYFAVVIPHDNGEAPEGKKFSDIPSFAPYENEPWTESEKGYAAMVTYLDNEVGKIIDKLKSLGLDENTLIVFTSDNGGDGSADGFFDECNQPFRGHKRDLYEGGIRVPFIARWPGTIAPGRESKHESAFWDFMPSACELAGVSSPATDGISYLPELIGETQAKHESFYFEFHEQGGKQAVLKDGWKCIRLNVKNPEKTTVELYNLKEDIQEQNNLAAKYPEKLEEMLALMKNSRTENEHFKLIP